MKRTELINRRKAKCLSQNQLAGLVGTTGTTIYRIESGQQVDLSGELLLKLAEALGFEVEGLRALFARGNAKAKAKAKGKRRTEAA